MEDVAYYRKRAQMTLELARQISDAKAAAGLRELAAQYQATADKLDGIDPSQGGERGAGDGFKDSLAPGSRDR